MSTTAVRAILAIMTWIFVCFAFSEIVIGYADRTADPVIYIPLWYQFFVYLLLPMAAASTLWLRLMGYFKIMSFAVMALRYIFFADWFYMAFVLPIIVLNQLRGTPEYRGGHMEYTVNYKDLLILIAFNVISITIIMIFSEISRAYRKAHDL